MIIGKVTLIFPQLFLKLQRYGSSKAKEIKMEPLKLQWIEKKSDLMSSGNAAHSGDPI